MKVLLAKTNLDGHWRGVSAVAQALRDGGFEVIVLGMARPEEIARAAAQEDVDLVGLNVGGRVEVVERAVDAVRKETGARIPLFAGGTVPPWARRRLETKGVEVYPPGTPLEVIVSAAKRLTAGEPPEFSRKPPEKARHLLDAAAHLFNDHGYGSVGMRSIAEAAGVTTGALYHHFRSKREILYKICLGMTREFVDANSPLLDQPGTVTERLKTLVTQHILFFWQRRVWLSVAFRELGTLNADEREEVTHHRRRHQHAIQRVIEEGVAAGELRTRWPRLSAIALLDMINGINEWFRPSGVLSIEELAALYADMVVDDLLGAAAVGDAENTRGKRSR